LRAAATDVDDLAVRHGFASMPAQAASTFDLIRAVSQGDSRAIDSAVQRVRDKVRGGRAVPIELQFLTLIGAQVLVRGGHADQARALLADLTAAGSPPPYDVIRMNPLFKGLANDPRARDMVARARTRFEL